MKFLRKHSLLTVVVSVLLLLGFMGAAPQALGLLSGGIYEGSVGAEEAYYGTPYSCPDGQTHLNLPEEGLNNRVCCPNGSEGDAQDCAFAKYLNPAVALMSIIVGTLVVIGMIMGGIQYSASAGDPQKAAAGKDKITKSILGLAAFLFLFSILQFFSPGGLSNKSQPGPRTASATTIAERCAKNFLGIKPWFVYLPDTVFGKDKNGDPTCHIENFSWVAPKGSKTPSNIPAIILAVADALVRIAGFVAVAFVIIGGVGYVTSGGDPDKSKRAKGAIINALVGVVIAMIATAVISYIGKRLT